MINDPIKQQIPGTRAVERLVAAGCLAQCVGCDTPIKFIAKVRGKQIICNVYSDAKWNRTEHFHHDCYIHAGQPHGAPDRAQAEALAKRRV